MSAREEEGLRASTRSSARVKRGRLRLCCGSPHQGYRPAEMVEPG
ncbi:unnamed protein product [Tetraodon nigroviridis]|uniref:(spotted green pufferfish) hypothetical protein n=1 Tax=Tetraodon nigroviridis TaxID=99883 RepID=Q4SYX5_TETNG|nr:unnamed protein product [Tetraodon nigroviridis]